MKILASLYDFQFNLPQKVKKETSDLCDVDSSYLKKIYQAPLSFIDFHKVFDKKYVDDISKLVRVIRVRIEEIVNIGGPYHIKVKEDHDVYGWHPQSQYSKLGPRPTNKAAIKIWNNKIRNLVAEKPKRDADTWSLNNTTNLLEKKYEALLDESEKALDRDPENLRAKIQNYVARFHINPSDSALNADFESIDSQLISIYIRNRTFLTTQHILKAMFNEISQTEIQKSIEKEKFPSLFEEQVLKSFHLVGEQDNYLNLLRELLVAGKDLNYLFLICQFLLKNASLIKANNKLGGFKKIKEFYELNCDIRAQSLEWIRKFLSELEQVESYHLNLNWDLAQNLADVHLLCALNESQHEKMYLADESF